MLVLISFGLVLVATVLLVLGLVQDSGLALIYVSIACSLAAGIILVIATRVNRPRSDAAGGTSTPLLVDEPSNATTPDVVVTPAPVPAPEPASAAAATPEPEPTDVGSAAAAESFAPVTESVTVVPSDDDELFPIADYDDLSVGEIAPLLPKLYADEIDVVEQRERAGKNRSEILERLAQLRVEFEGAPDDVTAEEWADQRGAELPPPAGAPAPSAPGGSAAAPTKKVVVPAPPKKATKKAPAAKKAAPAAKKAAPAAKKKAPAAKKAAPAAETAKKAAPAEETAKRAAAPAKKTPTKATKATKKKA